MRSVRKYKHFRVAAQPTVQRGMGCVHSSGGLQQHVKDEPAFSEIQAAAADHGDVRAAGELDPRKLQDINTTLEEQLGHAQAEAIALRAQMAVLEAKAAETDRLAEERQQKLQAKYEALKAQNNQLKRRVSDYATGHADSFSAAPQEPVDMPSTSYDYKARDVLVKVRDSNPHSKLAVLWRSGDHWAWQGVRTSGGEITGLALNGMSLTTLPSEIGDLKSLTTLLLSNNALSHLPGTLSQLKHLAMLTLDGNRLQQLPVELCELAGLQTLWLHENRLENVPDAVSRLTNLRHLLLHDNALGALPDNIGGLTSLTSLWLDNNKLLALPASIGQLTNLLRLRISEGLLPSVPEGVRPHAVTLVPLVTRPVQPHLA